MQVLDIRCLRIGSDRIRFEFVQINQVFVFGSSKNLNSFFKRDHRQSANVLYPEEFRTDKDKRFRLKSSIKTRSADPFLNSGMYWIDADRQEVCDDHVYTSTATRLQ